MGWFVLASLLDFNSRPHGGRLPHPAPLPGASGFQLTPSRRATIFSIDILLILVYFNSRPHGGRRGEHHSDCAHENYFNSRPHGGRLCPSSKFTLFTIFQLTPSRRATTICFGLVLFIDISTHALTEGDTICFGLVLFIDISTHALTEGDIMSLSALLQGGYFNSRPHGGRPPSNSHFTEPSTFQLTPSRRATRQEASCTRPPYFNSRPHGGRPLIAGHDGL